jgi:hypothetical protein
MDRRQLRKTLSKAVDGLADDVELQQVADALSADASLREEYVRFTQTETAIYHGLKRQIPEPRASDEGGRAAAAPANRPRTAFRDRLTPITTRRLWTGVGLAASLLVLIATVAWRTSSCASIVSLEAVTWKSANYFVVGDNLSREWIELESGKAIIGFDSSALIEVHGPARVKLTGDNSCHVAYGNVVALVPAAAKGFSVDTVSFEVVDLGTNFRVDANKGGTATLQVLEGVVTVHSKVSGETHKLLAGGLAIQDAAAALRVLDSETSIPVTSPRVVYRTKHVPSLERNRLRVDERCFLFLENAFVNLPYDLPINVAKPGRHSQFQRSEGQIDRGRTISSYLIHCSPSTERTSVQGEITFPGEILGVITSSDKLNATNSLFGSPWTLTCDDPQRGLETTPEANSDLIEISEDRRMLKIWLNVQAIDQVRVLVRMD